MAANLRGPLVCRHQDLRLLAAGGVAETAAPRALGLCLSAVSAATEEGLRPEKHARRADLSSTVSFGHGSTNQGWRLFLQ